MASVRDWWTWFRTGEPPAGYDNVDAWAEAIGVGCSLFVVIGAAVITYLIFR